MATIKTLLAMSVEQLEAMTDAELQAYCAPFLRIAEMKKPEEETDEEKQPGLVIDATGATGQAKKKARKKKEDDNKWLQEAARLMKKHNITGIELPKHL